MEELEGIVQRMIDAGEPEENIKLVIEEYENVNGLEKLNAVEDGATATAGTEEAGTDLALEDGSLESPIEKNTWLEDWVGEKPDAEDTLFGFTDLVSDAYRAAKSGWMTGASVNESLNLYQSDGEMNKEDLENLIKAGRRMEQSGPAKEQVDASNRMASLKKEGYSDMGAFMSAYWENPSALVFTAVSSLSMMASSFFDSEEVIASAIASSAAGAGVAAAAGAAYGSLVGPGGTVIGSGTGLAFGATSGFMSGITAAMETGLTTAQLLEESAIETGVDWGSMNDDQRMEWVRELTSDKERFNDIKSRAISRGLTIGAVDFVVNMATLGTAKGVSNIVSASRVSALTKPIAAVAAGTVETVGSGFGEYLGQKAAGQEYNFEEIALEGLGDKAITTVGIVKDFRKGNPSYSINGKKMNGKEMKENLEVMDDEAYVKADIKVEDSPAVESIVNNRRQNIFGDQKVDSRINNVEDRAEAIKLVIEKEKLSRKNKEGNKIAISQIDDKLRALEEKYKDSDVDATIDQRQKAVASAVDNEFEASFNKNYEAVIKASEVTGIKPTLYKTDLGYFKAIASTLKISLDEAKKQAKGSNGAFVAAGKIFINKQQAKRNVDILTGDKGSVTVASHEILHPIFNALIGGYADQKKYVADFKSRMTSKQRRYVVNALKERKYTEAEEATEFMNVFSDGIVSGEIDYDQTFFEKIGDDIVRLFKGEGFDNISFDNGKDVYNFLKEYNTSIKEGKLSDKAKEVIKKAEVDKDVKVAKAKPISADGTAAAVQVSKSSEVDKIEAEIDKLDDQLNDGSIDGDIYEERTAELFKQLADAKSRPEKEIKDKAKPKQRQGVTEAQKGLNKKVDDLVGEKNEDGNYIMTKEEWDMGGLTDAYEAIISGTLIDALIKRGISGEPSYLNQFTNDVKDGLTETLMRFNPEKNNSLIGFINGQLRFRKGDVLKSYKENLTASLDVESGEIGAITGIAAEEEFDVEAAELSEAKENAKKIKASERFIQSPKLRAKLKRRIAEDIKNVPTEKRTFKKAPFLAADIMAEEIGVPAKKIVDKKANLSSAELSKGAMYILKVADSIATLLPKGHVDGAVSSELQGTGSNIPGNVLRAYYDKDTSRLRTGPGLSPYIKKKNLSGKDRLAGIGVEDGKLRNNAYPRGAEGQTVKGLLNVITRLVENEYSRRFGDLTEQQVADYRGGLQDIQFSKNTEDIVNDIYADYDLFNSLSEVQFSRKTEYQNYLKKNRLDLQLLPEPEKNKAAKELVDSIFTWANSDAVPHCSMLESHQLSFLKMQLT